MQIRPIITKFIPASNTRGDRIYARCNSKSITVPYSFDGSAELCHRQAADALIRKLGWDMTGHRMVFAAMGKHHVFTPVANPIPRDMAQDQWWVAELRSAISNGVLPPDLRRAAAVACNLIAATLPASLSTPHDEEL